MRWVLICWTLAALLLWASHGHAQALCGSHADFVVHLGYRYQEFLDRWGVSREGALIEVFASQRGTWTMIATAPTGRSCVVATGMDWAAETTFKPGQAI